MAHVGHNRLISNALSELQEVNCSPIDGYEHLPLPTLDEAVEKIKPFISNIEYYVSIAMKKCNRRSSFLTRNESAAIYLYTMPQVSFFSSLNEALRNENRTALNPWLSFLKLLITALEKLPPMMNTVWRGVVNNVGSIFDDNDVHIWWSMNSCSLSLDVVRPYLGETGTLFAIEAIHGKDISEFSAVPDEKEVILMPGTPVRAKCEPLNFNNNLLVVHLQEEYRQR